MVRCFSHAVLWLRALACRVQNPCRDILHGLLVAPQNLLCERDGRQHERRPSYCIQQQTCPQPSASASAAPDTL
eukprot:4672651-Pyramimonas_sp.AAC.1